ncbi:hypothetical protein PpBr36_01538 [Pyricularia pennisetigena]|uniref:hypothetical protein n=1 Tax=Pyricularia pennisetigena TaxID=1578925 RepID=UPI00114D7F0F|nr:hypothetical protein PpBr36_01538 [Pyricularia pennisetigena]TLS28231.1 hypothetical protein PpBr36_01538 [Pyricularia pennisetigena]
MLTHCSRKHQAANQNSGNGQPAISYQLSTKFSPITLGSFSGWKTRRHSHARFCSGSDANQYEGGVKVPAGKCMVGQERRWTTHTDKNPSGEEAC